jgi:hypothetical protein
MVPRARKGATTVDVGPAILGAIDSKRKKGGAAYAAGKTLIVLLNAGGGPWFPNRVAEALPSPLYLAAVWVVGLRHVEQSGEYVYGAVQLDVSEGNAPIWLIRVAVDFNSWTVERIQ